MLTTRIAGQPVRLPDLERIGVAAVRDALSIATGPVSPSHEGGEAALLGDVRTAVLSEREAWATQVHADAELAIAKLAHAIDLAEEARDDLRDAVGVAGMLSRLADDPSAPLVVVERPYGYRFDLAPAIRGLLEALAAVSDEIATLNATRGLTSTGAPRKTTTTKGMNA